MRNNDCEKNNGGKKNNSELCISREMDRKNSLSIFLIESYRVIFRLHRKWVIHLIDVLKKCYELR